MFLTSYKVLQYTFINAFIIISVSLVGCASLGSISEIEITNIEPVTVQINQNRSDGLLIYVNDSSIKDMLIKYRPESQRYWFDPDLGFDDQRSYGDWRTVFGSVVCIVDDKIYKLISPAREEVDNVCKPQTGYAILLDPPDLKASGYDSFEEMLQAINSEVLMLFGLWPRMFKVPIKIKSKSNISNMLVSAIENPEVKVFIVYDTGYSNIGNGVIKY